MRSKFLMRRRDNGALGVTLGGHITVEPRYNDPRYNDIPGIMINMLCPGKSYSKMYGTEPQYNDLRYSRYNDGLLAH